MPMTTTSATVSKNSRHSNSTSNFNLAQNNMLMMDNINPAATMTPSGLTTTPNKFPSSLFKKGPMDGPMGGKHLAEYLPSSNKPPRHAAAESRSTFNKSPPQKHSSNLL